MGQNEKENTKFEVPVFEISSMEHRGGVDFDYENATGYPNPQLQNKDKEE